MGASGKGKKMANGMMAGKFNWKLPFMIYGVYPDDVVNGLDAKHTSYRHGVRHGYHAI